MDKELYHGSGSYFDSFDLSKSGEGSGTDVHGYGIYLTSDIEVAKFYADDIPSSKSFVYTVKLFSGLNILPWEEEIDDNTAQQIYQEFETRVDDESELEDLTDVLGLSNDYYGEYPLFSSLYDYLVDTLGSKQKASEFLVYAGIDGAMFNSKEMGFNTTNYVIYDESNMKILDVQEVEKSLEEYESTLSELFEYIQSHESTLSKIRKKIKTF